MALEIVALHERHLEGAAALVASTYRALRQSLPILNPAYEEASVYLPSLRHLVARSPGVAAVCDGRVHGFMTSLVIELLGQRCAYSPEWATAADSAESRYLYQEMYARQSAQWVADGCRLHACTLLASAAEAISALQWCGFGFVNVDAVRDLSPIAGTLAAATIRQATPGDLETATQMAELLRKHMAGPPVFWPHDERDLRPLLSQRGNALWLAEDAERCLGMLGVQSDNPDGLLILRDGKTAHVGAVFVAAPARRSGVTTGLLNHALQWARANGFERCAVDFESMNHVAARFWLKRFAPVAYSLLRWIPDQ